jgi:DNA-binding LytR/AlgR family response regulator
MFLRIHRSAIVHVGALRSLERSPPGAVAAVLCDGTRVPVSRSRREAVLASLGVVRG